VSTFCVTDEIPFFLQLSAPAVYLDLKEGEAPRLEVALQRQVGVSIQEVLVWRDMTSSQGVVEPLLPGTIPPPDPGVPASDPGPDSSTFGESRLTFGFKRSRSVNDMKVGKAGNLEMKTWEWRGTVRNSGVTVGGCLTEVMVINVSGSSFSLASVGGVDEVLVIGLPCILCQGREEEWVRPGVPPRSTHRDGV
jgi:hypothetical protein